MKLKRYIHIVLSLVVLIGFSLLPLQTTAQAQPQTNCRLDSFKDSFDCVQDAIRDEAGVAEQEPIEVILGILRVALTLAGILGVIALIIAGVRYMLSTGDEGEAKKAKQGIIYAVLGLIVIGASILIVNLIINAFQGTPQQPPPPGAPPPQQPPGNLPP